MASSVGNSSQMGSSKPVQRVTAAHIAPSSSAQNSERTTEPTAIIPAVEESRKSSKGSVRSANVANSAMRPGATTAPATAARTTAGDNPPTSRRYWLLKSPTFWNILLGILLPAIFQVVPSYWAVGPTKTNQHVDSARLDINQRTYTGDVWYWQYLYRQQCQQDQAASKKLDPDCIEILSQPLHPPPDAEGLTGLHKRTVSAVVMTSSRHSLGPSFKHISGNEGESSPNANDRKLPLDTGKYVLFMEAFLHYKDVCRAKRDSHRQLSATCQEALELWEHPKYFPDGSLDGKLSSDLVQIMLEEHNQRRFRSLLPMQFRRMTENHPKLQACVVVICIALATFIYMAADETRQPRLDGMQTALRMSVRWRFFDTFDTRSWNTWGTLLGIILYFLLASYSFPWEDEYTLNGGILALVSCLIVRVAITDFAIPWLTAYTLVRLAKWAFACKWHLESPWQLDEVYQEHQNILFSGMIIGNFAAASFENILYLSGYWGLLRDEDWKRLEL